MTENSLSLVAEHLRASVDDVDAFNLMWKVRTLQLPSIAYYLTLMFTALWTEHCGLRRPRAGRLRGYPVDPAA
jgi:hypothetical protein